MTQANNLTAESIGAAIENARDAEARKVKAYQRGYNDRMVGRAKDTGFGKASPDVLSYGSYLQGWADGAKNVAARN